MFGDRHFSPRHVWKERKSASANMRDTSRFAATSTGPLLQVARDPLPSAVRSWQKPLAGAVQRIRCHSHPRMLHHHSADHDPLPLPPPFAYFLLSPSLSPPLILPTTFPLTHDPPIYCIFKSFSLVPICRAIFSRFLPISPSWPPSPI